jgi:urate oxidase
MATLGPNRYGKSGIRLVTVDRRDDRHDLLDLTVDVRLEGDFAAAHVDGDNAAVLPTDTMRGTVYALARDGAAPVEAFGLRLARRFLDAAAAAATAHVTLVAEPWDRLGPTAFTGGAGRRTAAITATRDDAWVRAGLTDLVVLKTTGSGFSGFLRDEYTTLADTDDRILATRITADWRYDGLDVDWDEAQAQIRGALLDAFAAHDSASVQHTLHAMGEAALAARPDVAEIHLLLPNLHHVQADLSPYGLDNPGAVFVATDRPYGVIEATVLR